MRRLAPSSAHVPAPSSCEAEAWPAAASAEPHRLPQRIDCRELNPECGALASEPSVRGLGKARGRSWPRLERAWQRERAEARTQDAARKCIRRRPRRCSADDCLMDGGWLGAGFHLWTRRSSHRSQGANGECDGCSVKWLLVQREPVRRACEDGCAPSWRARAWMPAYCGRPIRLPRRSAVLRAAAAAARESASAGPAPRWKRCSWR